MVSGMVKVKHLPVLRVILLIRWNDLLIGNLNSILNYFAEIISSKPLEIVIGFGITIATQAYQRKREQENERCT